MRERTRERLRELDIHVIPWVDKWDALAAQWMLESDGDLEENELNTAVATDWFRSLREQPQNTIYAVTSKGSPVGVLGILNQNPVTRTAEIHGVLDRSVQGKGIGRLVGQNAVKTLFENGFQRLIVTPASSNREAMNMVSRLGFERSDRIVVMELARDKWLQSQHPSHDTKQELLHVISENS